MPVAANDSGWRWLYLAAPCYWGPTGTEAVKDQHCDLWFVCVSSIDADDDWLAWWLAHGPPRPECALIAFFQDEENKASVASATSPEAKQLLAPREGLSRTADEVRLYVRFDASWADTPKDLEGFVRGQVVSAMEELRTRLRLSPCPPPPWKAVAAK